MSEPLAPVYLIVGNDRPKVTRALARLRARFPETALERLSAREAGAADAVAACNALGLFGGGARLVVVEEADRWKDADVKALGGYLDDPAPETVLALVGDVKIDGALGKLVRKRGAVLAFDVKKKDLPRWIGEQFERRSVRTEPAACTRLIEAVGDDLERLGVEVEKLATWAASDTIHADDVDALVVADGDTPPFSLTDAWGRRDVTGVLAACERLLSRSDHARRDDLLRVAGLLARHIGRVAMCQRFAREGVSARSAAAKLRQHPFAIEKAYAHAARYSAEELRGAVVDLAELDFALKGGSRVPGDLELERTLVAVTGEAETAGLDRR